MFSIIRKAFTEFTRDRADLFFLLLFPCLLVFLLGNLLASQDQSEETVGGIRVQYRVEAGDPAEREALERLLSGFKENETIRFEETGDLEEAKKLVSKGELTAAVVFRDARTLELFEESQNIQNRTVKTLLTSLLRTAETWNTVSRLAPNAPLSPGQGKDGGELVKQKELGMNRSMLDYYAVSMLVMILFMGGVGGAEAFRSERHGRTINRLLISPKSRTSIYIQTVLGVIPRALTQILVVMLSSTLLFGAHYASDWQKNLLLCVMFLAAGLAVTAVCALPGLYLKKNASMTIMPVMWMIMFFSGTFSKEIYIKGLTEASPIWRIQNAAFDLTVFGHTGPALAVTVVCTAVFAVVLAAGCVVFHHRRNWV